MNRKVVCILILLILVSGIVFSENKTALVIGNSAYQNFPKLSRPSQEAKDMKAALERLGFEVIYVVDGTYDRMYDALYTFERKLKQQGGIALFHYGGHGIQVGGENYLLPIDKYIPDERRVKSRAVNAAEVVDLMAAAGSKTNIIILDACRDNPLPAATRSTNTRGLAKLNAPINTVVVYSAEAGDTAQDGVFTPTLLEYLEKPGMRFTDILQQTRRAVYEKTGGKQIPGTYDQLFNPIYLAGKASGSSSDTSTTTSSTSSSTQPKASTASKTYSLGGTGPAGGTIFYDKGSYSDGWRYLEAAPASTEWNAKEWGAYKETMGGTTTKIGSGKRNTGSILAFLMARGGESGKAAKLCFELSYGGYDDWFLPSKDELNLMYENLHMKGLGGFADDYYWSSSEYDNGSAWRQSFIIGNQNYYSKNYNYRVRAVRAF